MKLRGSTCSDLANSPNAVLTSKPFDMSSLNAQGKPFPFLKLPRELQEAVLERVDLDSCKDLSLCSKSCRTIAVRTQLLPLRKTEAYRIAVPTLQ